MIVVQKYGGSSVATPEKIMAIAKNIAEIRRTGKNLIVVCSAMGKTTNELIALAREITKNPSKREMDVLLSTGETKTVSLMAMALQELGVEAVSMTGFQSGFITNDAHLKAFIKEINTIRLESELEAGKVVVVAGFQGVTKSGHITTFGRGGSDITAVAIAAKLECPCDIFTDVDAIYTTDPRVFPKARALKEISYEEMMEMASLGAGVLETRSVELAKKYNVPLYLGRTLEKGRFGTMVKSIDHVDFEDMPVRGISIKENCAIVSFHCTGFERAGIFKLISENNINLDMINQNVVGDNIAFSFSCSDAQAFELQTAVAADNESDSPAITTGLVQLSLVGVGMATHTGVAVRAFEALGKRDIDYYQITSSEISISLTVDAENKASAVECLALEFGL